MSTTTSVSVGGKQLPTLEATSTTEFFNYWKTRVMGFFFRDELCADLIAGDIKIAELQEKKDDISFASPLKAERETEDQKAATQKRKRKIKQANRKIYSTLIEALGMSLIALTRVRVPGDGMAIWRAIMRKFESSTDAAKMRCVFEFVGLTQGSTEKVSAYIERHTVLVSRMASLKITLEDLHKGVLMRGLNAQYEVPKTTLVMASGNSLEKMTKKLLAYEDFAENSTLVTRKTGSANAIANDKCHNCNGLGHHARNCPKPETEKTKRIRAARRKREEKRREEKQGNCANVTTRDSRDPFAGEIWGFGGSVFLAGGAPESKSEEKFV